MRPGPAWRGRRPHPRPDAAPRGIRPARRAKPCLISPWGSRTSAHVGCLAADQDADAVRPADEVSPAAAGCAQPLAQPETWTEKEPSSMAPASVDSCSASVRAAAWPEAQAGAAGAGDQMAPRIGGIADEAERGASACSSAARDVPSGSASSARPGAGRTRPRQPRPRRAAKPARREASIWPNGKADAERGTTVAQKVDADRRNRRAATRTERGNVARSVVTDPVRFVIRFGTANKERAQHRRRQMAAAPLQAEPCDGAEHQGGVRPWRRPPRRWRAAPHRRPCRRSNAAT